MIDWRRREIEGQGSRQGSRRAASANFCGWERKSARNRGCFLGPKRSVLVWRRKVWIPTPRNNHWWESYCCCHFWDCWTCDSSMKLKWERRTILVWMFYFYIYFLNYSNNNNKKFVFVKEFVLILMIYLIIGVYYYFYVS